MFGCFRIPCLLDQHCINYKSMCLLMSMSVMCLSANEHARISAVIVQKSLAKQQSFSGLLLDHCARQVTDTLGNKEQFFDLKLNQCTMCCSVLPH